MAFNQVTQNLSKNRTDMSELQNQAATQKRINKPSDDPSASARVLANRTEERGGKQFLKNINVARSFLEFTDQSLSELSETLMRAKELAIQQANDAGGSSETRKTVASEIEQIYSQAVQIGNRKMGDRYIFAGFNTTTPPFDHSGEYAGDNGDMNVQINKDAFVAMNVSGDKIFFGKGLGDDGQIRSNGKVPRNTDQLQDHKTKDIQRGMQIDQENQGPVPLRAPASTSGQGTMVSVADADTRGVNIIKALKDFEIGLRTNDKNQIQMAIDDMDASLSQVINIRAQVGSRVSSLNSAYDSLQKSIVDNKTNASLLEDADLFEVVSEMNKTDSALKATLETSGKVMNMSLLDFLR